MRAHDRRLLQGLHALDDASLDRARAHLAAGLPIRRADLGWRGSGPAREGCVVGVAMSRRRFWAHPLRAPGLLLLAAIFDAWAYEEARRVGDRSAARSRRLGPLVHTRLAELLDIEWHRRNGWPGPPTPAPSARDTGAVKIAR
ncbi:MAG: hypothetical protein ACP5PW_03665 [Candidatus Dormibacteria bacterium]